MTDEIHTATTLTRVRAHSHRQQANSLTSSLGRLRDLVDGCSALRCLDIYANDCIETERIYISIRIVIETFINIFCLLRLPLIRARLLWLPTEMALSSKSFFMQMLKSPLVKEANAIIDHYHWFAASRALPFTRRSLSLFLSVWIVIFIAEQNDHKMLTETAKLINHLPFRWIIFFLLFHFGRLKMSTHTHVRWATITITTWSMNSN